MAALKVTRTELIILGEENFDEAAVRGLWAELCGEANASLRVETRADGVHLLLYPFRHYEVYFETGEMSTEQVKTLRADVAWSRKLIIDGIFPLGMGTADELWVPIRKCKVEDSSHYDDQSFDLPCEELRDLRHIACTTSNKRSVDQVETLQKHTTEINFWVSSTDQEDWSDERITRTLDNAVLLFGNKLREHIEDKSPAYMDCVWLLDQLSADFADALVSLGF